MERERLVPVALAVAGFAAIVIGIHQGLIHVAPGYEGTITTGWGGDLNHEERLLAGVGAAGTGGTVALLRWKRLAIVPVATGGVVLFYALRAILQTVRNTRLYTETTMYGDAPVVFVLGAEPFLLIAGGLLLVGAGGGDGDDSRTERTAIGRQTRRRRQGSADRSRFCLSRIGYRPAE